VRFEDVKRLRNSFERHPPSERLRGSTKFFPLHPAGLIQWIFCRNLRGLLLPIASASCQKDTG